MHYITVVSHRRPEALPNGSTLVDSWSAHDSIADARDAYAQCLTDDSLYSASVCAVMESTCYGEQADARLIAAAPELLATCRELLELHIAHHNEPVHAAARAAIARATGGDQ